MKKSASFYILAILLVLLWDTSGASGTSSLRRARRSAQVETWSTSGWTSRAHGNDPHSNHIIQHPYVPPQDHAELLGELQKYADLQLIPRTILYNNNNQGPPVAAGRTAVVEGPDIRYSNDHSYNYNQEDGALEVYHQDLDLPVEEGHHPYHGSTPKGDHYLKEVRDEEGGFSHYEAYLPHLSPHPIPIRKVHRRVQTPKPEKEYQPAPQPKPETVYHATPAVHSDGGGVVATAVYPHGHHHTTIVNEDPILQAIQTPQQHGHGYGHHKTLDDQDPVLQAILRPEPVVDDNKEDNYEEPYDDGSPSPSQLVIPTPEVEPYHIPGADEVGAPEEAPYPAYASAPKPSYYKEKDEDIQDLVDDSYVPPPKPTHYHGHKITTPVEEEEAEEPRVYGHHHHHKVRPTYVEEEEEEGGVDPYGNEEVVGQVETLGYGGGGGGYSDTVVDEEEEYPSRPTSYGHHHQSLPDEGGYSYHQTPVVVDTQRGEYVDPTEDNYASPQAAAAEVYPTKVEQPAYIPSPAKDTPAASTAYQQEKVVPATAYKEETVVVPSTSTKEIGVYSQTIPVVVPVSFDSTTLLTRPQQQQLLYQAPTLYQSSAVTNPQLSQLPQQYGQQQQVYVGGSSSGLGAHTKPLYINALQRALALQKMMRRGERFPGSVGVDGGGSGGGGGAYGAYLAGSPYYGEPTVAETGGLGYPAGGVNSNNGYFVGGNNQQQQPFFYPGFESPSSSAAVPQLGYGNVGDRIPG